MKMLGWEVGKKYKTWANVDEVLGFRYSADWKSVNVVVKGLDGRIREHQTPRDKRDIELH